MNANEWRAWCAALGLNPVVMRRSRVRGRLALCFSVGRSWLEDAWIAQNEHSAMLARFDRVTPAQRRAKLAKLAAAESVFGDKDALA